MSHRPNCLAIRDQKHNFIFASTSESIDSMSFPNHAMALSGKRMKLISSFERE